MPLVTRKEADQEWPPLLHMDFPYRHVPVWDEYTQAWWAGTFDLELIELGNRVVAGLDTETMSRDYGTVPPWFGGNRGR